MDHIISFPHNQELCLSSKHTSLPIMCLVKYFIWTHNCCTRHYCINNTFQIRIFFNKLISDLSSHLLLHLNYLKLPPTALKARAAINRMQTKQYTVMQSQKHDLRTCIYNWPKEWNFFFFFKWHGYSHLNNLSFENYWNFF